MELESARKIDISEMEVLERAKEHLVRTMASLFGEINVTEEAIKKDKELFQNDIPYRKWLALFQRVNMKEIY